MTGTLQEICAEAGASGCVDLTADLVPTYLSAIPKDPQATSTNTLYQIAINPTSQTPVLTASNSTEFNLEPVQIGTTTLAGGGGVESCGWQNDNYLFDECWSSVLNDIVWSTENEVTGATATGDGESNHATIYDFWDGYPYASSNYPAFAYC